MARDAVYIAVIAILLLIGPVSVHTGAAYVPADGTMMRGVYNFDSVTFASGTVVTFDRDVTINANSVTVLGTIHGVRASSELDAPSLWIRANVSITIHGTIIAASGGDGTSSTTLSAPTGRGGHGGSILLETPPLGSILVGQNALIASGGGGTGGSANIRDNTTTSNVSAIAGDGGRGGNLGIMAGSSSLSGHLLVGSGGDGGDAEARTLRASARAQGGAGGTPGGLATPAGYSPTEQIAAGRLSGAGVGDGGDATAVAVCLFTCPGDGEFNRTRGDPGLDGEDATTPGAPGGSGARGHDAVAIAGDGRPNCVLISSPHVCFALDGGNGGTAYAFAGSGGAGGRGGTGSTDGSSSVPGGKGGIGGLGGDASAYAGEGGCATFGASCGAAGAASAQTRGGLGGDGGAGGWASSSAGGIESACQTDEGAGCWMPTVSVVCGHAGRGGPGGPPGVAVASRPGGTGTTVEEPGEEGQPGGFPEPSCDHGAAHGHYP